MKLTNKQTINYHRRVKDVKQFIRINLITVVVVKRKQNTFVSNTSTTTPTKLIKNHFYILQEEH